MELSMSNQRNVGDECDASSERPARAAAPARRHAELLNDPEFVWSVLANSAEAIEVLDLDARIQFISAAALRALHLDDGDALIGTPWLAHWREDAQARAAVAAARTGRTSTFEAQRGPAKGEATWWEVTVAPIRGSGGQPVRLLAIARDVSMRRNALQSQQAMRLELHHRMKNTLAMAMAIASQSLARAPSIAEGRLAIERRLMALADVHNVLREGEGNGATLREIIERAIAPFDAAPSRFSLSGDEVTLSSSAALAAAMALHELAANAVKHGALSAKAGRVDVAWRVEPATGRLRLDWRERGGPAIAALMRPGFGMRVIEASFRDQLGGSVDFSFDPSGLRCAIEAPLNALRGRAAGDGAG
jgi:PAS domain S-box-containing protein